MGQVHLPSLRPVSRRLPSRPAGLRQVDRGEVPITLDYPTEEIACRAFMAGGGGAQAIRHSGEERVRQTIRDTLQRFRVETGHYRIENRFHYVIAQVA